MEAMIQQLRKMIEDKKNENEVLDMKIKSLESGRMDSRDSFDHFHNVLDEREAARNCLRHLRKSLANLRYAAGHSEFDVDVFEPERF